MPKPCVLVIEDEPRYRELLELNLTRRGYQVVSASDGLSGLNLLESSSPHLIILDLILPDFDGFEVCRRIRAYSAVPIIMLTGRAEEIQKVRGLTLGADDYVTKPFGAAELVARVEAVLRRYQQLPVAPRLVVDELVVDFAEHRVSVRGQDLELTPLEYKLLRQLALNPGRILVQEDLLRRVWGLGYEDQAEVLHTTIRRLRRKLEPNPARPRYILTQRGIGYSLVRPGASENVAVTSRA